MNNPKKSNLFSMRSLSVGLAFVLTALIVGVYFLFRPFPAGPSLTVKANAPQVSGGQEMATVNRWYAFANPSDLSPKSEAATINRWYAYANPKNLSGMAEAATVNRWYAFANPSDLVPVQEAATVNHWYEYANPRTLVNIDALRYPMHTK
jgi:hypothetical protein